jgi:adenylate cyclase 1
LFNTLQVRSAIGQAGSGAGGGQRRKLSFRNVSNVVVQLLHSIKYSVEVPFSNMTTISTSSASPEARGNHHQTPSAASSPCSTPGKKVKELEILQITAVTFTCLKIKN